MENKHVNVTSITTEWHLRGQLSKNTVMDTSEDILKNYAQHTQYNSYNNISKDIITLKSL